MKEADAHRLKLIEAQNTLEQLLIGKEVRVYSEGQPLTQDFVINRVNIEIEMHEDTIKHVWFG